MKRALALMLCLCLTAALAPLSARGERPEEPITAEWFINAFIDWASPRMPPVISAKTVTYGDYIEGVLYSFDVGGYGYEIDVYNAFCARIKELQGVLERKGSWARLWHLEREEEPNEAYELYGLEDERLFFIYEGLMLRVVVGKVPPAQATPAPVVPPTLAPTVPPTPAPTAVPTPTPPAAPVLPDNYLTVEIDGEETALWLARVDYPSYNDDKTVYFERYDENGYCVGTLAVITHRTVGTETFDSAKLDERNIFIHYKDEVKKITYQAYKYATKRVNPAGGAFHISFMKKGSVFSGTFSATLVSEQPLGGMVFKNGKFHFDDQYGEYPVPTIRPGAKPHQAAAADATQRPNSFTVQGSPAEVQVWEDCHLCGGAGGRDCQTCDGDGWVEGDKIGEDWRGRDVYEAVRCQNVNCVYGWVRCVSCSGDGGRLVWK